MGHGSGRGVCAGASSCRAEIEANKPILALATAGIEQAGILERAFSGRRFEQ
ncbi:MAG: hypothetical protein ACLQJ7_19710 [Syntrophobacteraceae bacterium]